MSEVLPEEVFKHLAKGDPFLAEYIFKYSIPEIYRVGVIK